MPPKHTIATNTNDVFDKRIRELEDQVRRLTTNRVLTAPIYDQMDYPSAAIDGQLMVGLNDRIHAFGSTSQQWHGVIHEDLHNEVDYVTIITSAPDPNPSPLGGGFNVTDTGGGINLIESGAYGIISYIGTFGVWNGEWAGGFSAINQPLMLVNDGGASGGAPSIFMGINAANKDSFVVFNSASIDEMLMMVGYGDPITFTPSTGGSFTSTFYEDLGVVRTNAIIPIPAAYGGGNGVAILGTDGTGVEITSYGGGGTFFNDYGAGGTFFDDNNGGGTYFQDYEGGGFNVEIGIFGTSGGGEIYIANRADGSGGGIFIGNRLSGGGDGNGPIELRNEGTGDMILNLAGGGLIHIPIIPTTDPGISGAVWADPITNVLYRSP